MYTKFLTKTSLQELIRHNIKHIFKEISDMSMKSLYVFDFDDTLVKTQDIVRILNKSTGTSKYIKTKDFHDYNLQPNEEFDLSSVTNELIEPKILQPQFKLMKTLYTKLGPESIAICTARPSGKSVRKFLNQQGLPGIKIAALGDIHPPEHPDKINALRKKTWLKAQIINRQLKHLEFWDDNLANVQAAASLSNEHPETTVIVHHVV